MHGARAANPRRRHRRRRYNSSYDVQTHRGFLGNPAYGPLFENPMGAYSRQSLIRFGLAILGLGIGAVGARFVDRMVATRTPKDSKDGTKAMRAWYGSNAVAAINRRPDIMRLGVQAGGAVVGIGAAAALRRLPLVPWLMGGLALGFGTNFVLQVVEWYAIPYLLKVKDPGEQTIANRTYALEQVDVQDSVDAIYDDWHSKPALAAAQTDTPTILGPLGTANVYQLGAARPGAAFGANRKFVPDGRVGHCAECGGDGGHYSGCPQCELCNGGGGGKRYCAYTVQQGSDVYQVAAAAGITVGDISSLNGGGTPDSFWVIGREVKLPESACNVLLRGGVPTVPQQPTGTPLLQHPPPPALAQMPLRTAVPAPSPATMAVYGTPEERSVAYALAGGE